MLDVDKIVNCADLEKIAHQLRILGIRPALCADGALWFGRVCLYPDGTATLDGRASHDARDVGLALNGLADALKRVASPEGQGQPAPWRAGPPRLRGKRVQAETVRLLQLAEAASLPVRQVSTGRWIIAERVLFVPATGRIRILPNGRTFERRGLEALSEVLRQKLGGELMDVR